MFKKIREQVDEVLERKPKCPICGSLQIAGKFVQKERQFIYTEYCKVCEEEFQNDK